jgi:hypothetical protein
MLRHVALVRTDVLEEHSASIIRVKRIGELRMLADSFHPDDGGDMLLQNIGSYKSHMASQPQKTAFFIRHSVNFADF